MKKLRLVLVAVFLCLMNRAGAQDTNALKTTLGVYEAQASVMLIKGFGDIGSLPVGSVQIDLHLKQTRNAATDEVVYGLSLLITGNGPVRQRVLVDEDEVDPLLNNLNYLLKINYAASPLPGFEASYLTKAGLRLLAESQRRDGGVQFFLQYGDTPRIPLSSLQLTQLGDLIQQARKAIANLKDGK